MIKEMDKRTLRLKAKTLQDGSFLLEKKKDINLLLNFVCL